jgi:hypothetical protein
MTASERIHRGAEKPTNADVEQALGPDEPLWDGLVADLETEYDVAMCDWNSDSPKPGWSLRVKRGNGPFSGWSRARAVSWWGSFWTRSSPNCGC